jgi:predicted HTH domain antitoxin
VAIEIPDELSSLLTEKWGDVPRHILENVATEAYTSGALTALQIRRLLGHDSRMETLNFLSERGVWPRYDVEDLQQDMATLDRVLGR